MADSSTKSQNQTGKDPLKALEGILNEAKKSPPPKKDQAQALKEVAVKEQQQKQEDAAQIKSKLQELQTVKDSPQYQAAQDQKQAAEQQQSEEQAQLEGNEIIQLKHTKI